MMEVCDVWLARDFLARHSRPVDIPPCTCPFCPPVTEGAPMTTTPTPTDHDTAVDAAARAIQAYQARTAFPPEQYTWDAIPQEWRDRHLAAARVMVEAAMTPLLDELAKTRAELTRAEQRARMATQHARRCDAQVADADAEVARLQSWLADERAKWLRHQAEDHPVDVEANPAATAEPADEPCDPTAATLSDSTPMLCADCGKRHKTQVRLQAEPADEPKATIRTALGDGWSNLLNDDEPQPVRNLRCPLCKTANPTWAHMVACTQKPQVEPADEPKATCGHAYIGNEGEFTCDLYAPHNGKQHWNSLAEFAWTDERAA